VIGFVFAVADDGAREDYLEQRWQRYGADSCSLLWDGI